MSRHPPKGTQRVYVSVQAKAQPTQQDLVNVNLLLSHGMRPSETSTHKQQEIAVAAHRTGHDVGRA